MKSVGLGEEARQLDMTQVQLPELEDTPPEFLESGHRSLPAASVGSDTPLYR